MALSKGARAVRAAGYGTLANFREVRSTTWYGILAKDWAKAKGAKGIDGKPTKAARRAPLASTSRLAYLYGRAYIDPKTGLYRKTPNRRYTKILARELGWTVEQVETIAY